MAWTVEYDPRSEKELAKIAKPVAKRILDYMDAVAELDDPTIRGKPLVGSLAGLWRYRVGDWRVICDLDTHRLVIVAVEVAHRSRVYAR